MSRVVLKIIPDPEKNQITYSRNYRLFTSQEPIASVDQLLTFSDNVTIGSGNDIANLHISFRYSTDQANWSLWYDFSPTNIQQSLDTIILDDTKDFFAEFKYQYDNGTSGVLPDVIKINEIKLGLNTTKAISSNELFTPNSYCSAETCPAIIADRLASFQPYSVDNAVGIYQELTFQTNKIFGQDVVYFRTEPDWKEGDYIFKEWTIYKLIDRKCIKVLLDQNNFPDNKPSFASDGVNFVMPFEIHIDHRYFQSIFGAESQPRKRDFLFFPLINRMYEIQGSYLFRGFMMTPAYWRVHLKMFNPNIDMVIDKKNKTVIDNLIISSEDMFSEQTKAAVSDATDPKQLTTISQRFDEARSYLNTDMFVANLNQTYNYGPLIDYYYDMTGIPSTASDFDVIDTGGSDRVYLTGSPTQLIAYEDSAIFTAWSNGDLRSGDLNLNSVGQAYRIFTDGPKLDASTGKRYVVISANTSLAFSSGGVRDMYLINPNTIRFKTRANGVVYKEKASLSGDKQNLTYSSLFQINNTTTDFFLLRAYNETSGEGIQIYGQVVNQLLTIYLKLNDKVYTFPVGAVVTGKWYQIFVPVSAEFKQAGVYVYSFNQDPANTQNYDQLILNYASNIKIQSVTFADSDYYNVPSGSIYIANVRVFKTMIQEEDHDYLISQLIFRDESMLYVIDNGRPRLGAPYITRNR